MSDRRAVIDEIIQLHELMTKHVVNAGVGEQRWDKLVHNIDRRSVARLELIHSFLGSLHQNEWRAIDTTWNLPNATEEMWENMEMLFDEHTFPEMKRLRDEQWKLKEKWLRFKEQYSALIKSEREDKEAHELDD